jgi:hypothetical protein
VRKVAQEVESLVKWVGSTVLALLIDWRLGTWWLGKRRFVKEQTNEAWLKCREITTV